MENITISIHNGCHLIDISSSFEMILFLRVLSKRNLQYLLFNHSLTENYMPEGMFFCYCFPSKKHSDHFSNISLNE